MSHTFLDYEFKKQKEKEKKVNLVMICVYWFKRTFFFKNYNRVVHRTCIAKRNKDTSMLALKHFTEVGFTVMFRLLTMTQ